MSARAKNVLQAFGLIGGLIITAAALINLLDVGRDTGFEYRSRVAGDRCELRARIDDASTAWTLVLGLEREAKEARAYLVLPQTDVQLEELTAVPDGSTLSIGGRRGEARGFAWTGGEALVIDYVAVRGGCAQVLDWTLSSAVEGSQRDTRRRECLRSWASRIGWSVILVLVVFAAPAALNLAPTREPVRTVADPKALYDKVIGALLDEEYPDASYRDALARALGMAGGRAGEEESRYAVKDLIKEGQWHRLLAEANRRLSEAQSREYSNIAGITEQHDELLRNLQTATRYARARAERER